MSGRKAVEIKRFGLTQVYGPEDDSMPVAIIVFVHGLFGHPQRTWTGQKEPEPGTLSSRYQTINASKAHSNIARDSLITERLSMSTESPDQIPEASQDTLPGYTSKSGIKTPRSSMMESSQITGLQPGEVFWPEAILPSVLPETRIFTWGYDADVDAFNTSVGHNNVEQHANDLLADIANLLGKLGDLTRPIIFVVHSLGGIVVKEALNIASQSEIERLKGVASATYGISFLGTPHRGSGSATIGKHAYRIARLASKRPNIKLLRSLEKNSDTLKGISNRFRSTQQKWGIKISSFYEDREVRKFFLFHSLIVDNESAQIGHAGEEVSSIPKNHREMTKFTSSEEVGFDRVSSQLKRWVIEINNNYHRSGTWIEEFEHCLSSLENPQTRARYINVATSYDGTFQWLFDSDIVSFVDWLEEDQGAIGPSRPIFWINGKPGSGKSTLMKFAMRDKRTQDCLRKGSGSEWIILGFFFHDRGSLIQKSIDGMLQAVLHQLLSQVPNLLRAVYTGVYANLVTTQQKANPVWTFDALCAAWVAVTEQRIEPLRICIFLDALDEHDGDNSQLANFIYQLVSSADSNIVRIKICVASRSWNIFGEHFGTCPQFAIHEHTAGDIQAYTSEKLSPPMMNLAEDALLALSQKIERLSLQVTTKARGVFIWVRIVIDELVKGIRDGTSLSLLEEKVSQMPEELGDLYRHTLEKIDPDYVEEAYIMLQITLCSLEPLSIETFAKTVSFSRWRKIHELSEEEIIRQLASRSGGLLEFVEIVQTTGYVETIPDHFQDNISGSLKGEIESSVDQHLNVGGSNVPFSSVSQADPPKRIVHMMKAVQFIHQTVKDFVAENRNDLGLHLSSSTFKSESGNLYLLDCATHFGRRHWARELSRSMWEYAFLAEVDGVSDMSRFRDIFAPMINAGNWDEGQHPQDSLSFESWIIQELPQYASSLGVTGVLSSRSQLKALAAAAALKDFLTYELSTHGHLSPYVLAMAATGKRLSTSSASRESMVKLILSFGADSDDPIPALDVTTVDPFHASTTRVQYNHPRTTLAWILRQKSQQYISKEERLSLATLLLENGADPNTRTVPDSLRGSDRPGRPSLLYTCILHYDVEAVKLLLLHEADIFDIDRPLIFNVLMTEQIRGRREMSKVLKEYHVQTLYPMDLIPISARLVMQSGCLIGIGSSKIGRIFGRANYKTNMFLRQYSSASYESEDTQDSLPAMRDYDAESRISDNALSDSEIAHLRRQHVDTDSQISDNEILDRETANLRQQ